MQLVKRVISNIHGNQPQSLGLYPAFYYYSSKGQYKDFLFLLFLSWASNGNSEEILRRKIQFTLARDLFEEVWMIGKDWIFQAYGRKGAGPTRITLKYSEMLQNLIALTLKAKEKSRSAFDVLDEFLKEMDAQVHTAFVRQYEQDQGKPFGRFSESTKLQSEFLALFHNATQRCATCGGRILFGSHQVDHVKNRGRGGTNSPENADIKHPFCNNHKDKLEGLKKVFGKASMNQAFNLQVPKPRPDSTLLAQLTFDYYLEAR